VCADKRNGLPSFNPQRKMGRQKRQAGAKELWVSMQSVFLMLMGSINALGCYYSWFLKID